MCVAKEAAPAASRTDTPFCAIFAHAPAPVRIKSGSMSDEQKQFPGSGQPCTTTAPVTPGNFSDTAKEFGRTKDVERVFSVKRGTLYTAEKLGVVRGVLLRLRGQKSGVKLWDMRSIERWIRGEMKK